ncbi:hypothetical protein GBA52_025348, partial [Prunus armeniaca]
MLKGSEFVGAGALVAPEDAFMTPKSGADIHTGEGVENTIYKAACLIISDMMGEGQYWIALTTEVTPYWGSALRYPFIRKVLVIVKRYAAGKPHLEKNAGAFAVNLNGEPTAHYSDPELVLITSGIKIGNYLYCGST